MTKTPRITLNNVSFHLDQTPVRFKGVNLNFEKLKYGIVGKNGSGKTSFLKLLLGEYVPDSGKIESSASIINSPQSHASIHNNATIADALGVMPRLEAIKRISEGSLSEEDFNIAANHWDIEKCIEGALRSLNLWPINLNRLFHTLSGGQKTKILLAKTQLFNADFTLFDEPTNNLDRTSRNALYDYISHTAKAMIIVSHDRTLLNHCDKIIEINSKGIDVYGGNYDFYKTQKQIKEQALAQSIQAQTEILEKSKKTIQKRMEKHEQGTSRGKTEKAKQIKGMGRYHKIEIKSKKGKSENTNRHIRLQADRKLESINAELSATRQQVEIQKDLNIMLEKTSVPSSKRIISMEHVDFAYQQSSKIINDFSMLITGPERIAITGENGSGKSTLLQLIRGSLTPKSGIITLGVKHIAYLDQAVSFLDPHLNLVENFLRLNPSSKPFDAYTALASFQFRNKDAEKCVTQLSGGERMRAGLAISLMASDPPQLMILDEPTNHLDLDTIESVENALKAYRGAILAVSHDAPFLSNIKIKRFIHL